MTVEQKYVNRENRPIETVYMFPVEEESAVVELEAEIDGRTIKTEVKKREEAKQDYNQVQLLSLELFFYIFSTLALNSDFYARWCS